MPWMSDDDLAHGRRGWRVSVRVRFEPRDLWIGVYWTRDHRGLSVYICVLPMLPIILRWGA